MALQVFHTLGMISDRAIMTFLWWRRLRQVRTSGPADFHHKDTKAQRKISCSTLPTQFSEEPLLLAGHLAEKDRLWTRLDSHE